MESKDYEIPTNKKGTTIFLIVMILLGLAMLVVTSPLFHKTSEPENLMQISCTFDSFERKQHTRSFSYDLLLISDEYDFPFKLSFFDGYKKQYSPEDFCNGNTYFLLVSPNASSYEIYSFSDAEGNLLMTKKEAYHNSQKIASILLPIMLLSCISCFTICIFIIHRPDLFGEWIKRIFFQKRKSI